MNFSTDFLLLAILSLSAISQAIFGVGVLLWGTPILVLIGIEFIEAVSILIPISLTISAIQLVPNREHLDKNAALKFIVYALPLMIVSLVFSIVLEVKVEWIVFFALFMGGLIRTPQTKKISKKFIRHRDMILPFVGLVHGVSNLGGSILVLWAGLYDNAKLKFRTLVAGTYFFLALAQIVTLAFMKGTFTFYVNYYILTCLIYILFADFIFGKLSNMLFDYALTILIFAMSFLMLLRAADFI